MSKQQILLIAIAAFFAGIVSANTIDVSAMHLTKCGMVKYLNAACAQQADV
jgi:hypothetical protein